MAKTIKFNLICDGNSIRTIEELRNNFSVEDVLSYYQSGLLERWLKVRGYNEELKQLETVDKKDELSIIKSLIKIFEIEANESDIKRDTYIFQYQKEHEKQMEEYLKSKATFNKTINDSFSRYANLVNEIIENKNDMPKIKAAIKTIDKKYRHIFELNYRELFYLLYDEAPKAIFAMLMIENMRDKYIGNPIGSFASILPFLMDESLTERNSNESSTKRISDDKKLMNNKIRDLVNSYSYLKDALGDDLKEYSGNTDGYWNDVAFGGTKCMIIKMEKGTHIRSQYDSDPEMSASEINGNFVILNGIRYKSLYSDYKLLYMEV